MFVTQQRLQLTMSILKHLGIWLQVSQIFGQCAKPLHFELLPAHCYGHCAVEKGRAREAVLMGLTE